MKQNNVVFNLVWIIGVRKTPFLWDFMVILKKILKYGKNDPTKNCQKEKDLKIALHFKTLMQQILTTSKLTQSMHDGKLDSQND